MKEEKELYPSNLKIWYFGCAKAPGLSDLKRACIDLILARLRSLKRGSFRAAQIPNFEVTWVYLILS
jgi:hypothetical protein